MRTNGEAKRVKKRRTQQKENLDKKPIQEGEVVKKQFDFGGLPDREFKKNLGCG